MHFLREKIFFPPRLADSLSEYFWRTQAPAPSQLKNTAAALANLWPKLAKSRGQIGSDEKHTHYSFQSAEAQAYAAYYLTANALKLPLVLAEAESLGIELVTDSTDTWLDIGSGPGTAAVGMAWWAAHRKRPGKFVSMDQSQIFLREAEALLGKLRQSISGEQPHFLTQKAPHAAKIVASALELKPKIISFVNSIAEIFPEPRERGAAVSRLLGALAAEASRASSPRWLLIIEPGSRESSRELLQLREELRSQAGLEIFLPCLDRRPCGALQLEKDWCHEEVACEFPVWLNQLGSAAGIRKEAMLFSYLLVAVGLPEKSAAWPEAGIRMVSQRMQHKGLTECWFCTPAGKERYRFSHSVQRKREVPLPEPVRGSLYRSLRVSEKKEVEAQDPISSEASAYDALFPTA